MKILIACEESQAVCCEMRKLGHEAYSADIQDPSGGHPEWHILGDVLPLINGNCRFKTMDGVQHEITDKWDMLIAHPPCTYLSNAGAKHLFRGGKLNQERYQRGLAAKEFFLAFLNADCPKIAVENPVSSRIYEMPPCTQEIQPWQFGHPLQKKTRLWLIKVCRRWWLLILCNMSAVVMNRGTWFMKGGKDRQKKRSKTFPGIARAMAEQWAGGDGR